MLFVAAALLFWTMTPVLPLLVKSAWFIWSEKKLGMTKKKDSIEKNARRIALQRGKKHVLRACCCN